MEPKKIELIIKRTFDLMDIVFSNNREDSEATFKKDDSHLLFPTYREKRADGKIIRVSEQELRFLFVETFSKVCKEEELYYSIETPTENKYKFFRNNNKVPQVNPPVGGKSASIDLTIYTKKENELPQRVAIIEFKKDGCSAHDIAKDILKLSMEPNVALRYFILVSDSDTPLEKETGKSLRKAFVDKFELFGCFDFSEQENRNQIFDWKEIAIRWHRLPSDNRKDNNFTALFKYKNGCNGVQCLSDFKTVEL